MTELAKQKCKPCEGGVPPFNAASSTKNTNGLLRLPYSRSIALL